MPRRFLDSAAAPFALVFFCLILHVIGTWAQPLINRDEPRFAEASREMRERGDYAVPYFNNQLRLDKPPLIYWCQVGCYRVFGENEFAARLPSAVASALTALVVFGFGSRLYGRRIGLHAALVFTLSLHVIWLSKASVADMCMVLFVALASWAGWELCAGASPHRARWWWTFYLALALGFLAKGPVAWLPIGTVLLFFAWTRHAGLNRAFQFHLGIPLMLAVVALWGIPALRETHGEYFRIGIGRHVVERSFVAFETHGANGLPGYLAFLPFYFVTLFASFFPWSFFLPRMVSHFKKPGNRQPAEIYLLGGIALTFLIFTLLSTKLPHYVLPAFPLLSILLAGYFGESRFPIRWAVVMAILTAIFSLAIPPLSTRYFPVAKLAREAAPWLKPETQIVTVDFQEPDVVWNFRAHVRGWITAVSRDDAIDFMKQPGPRACLALSAIAETFQPDPAWKKVTSEGINLATGRKVQLTLWIKET
jgi:4-amino-4-deoxy-L-arabinose transferase-like glycosyltransferase